MNPQQLEIYNKNFELFVRRILFAEISDCKLKDIAQKVKSFYFGNRSLCQDTLLEYVDVSKFPSTFYIFSECISKYRLYFVNLKLN